MKIPYQDPTCIAWKLIAGAASSQKTDSYQHKKARCNMFRAPGPNNIRTSAHNISTIVISSSSSSSSSSMINPYMNPFQSQHLFEVARHVGTLIATLVSCRTSHTSSSSHSTGCQRGACKTNILPTLSPWTNKKSVWKMAHFGWLVTICHHPQESYNIYSNATIKSLLYNQPVLVLGMATCQGLDLRGSHTPASHFRFIGNTSSLTYATAARTWMVRKRNVHIHLSYIICLNF